MHVTPELYARAGGWAYPTEYYQLIEGEEGTEVDEPKFVCYESAGMTLLDYFAGQAIVGIISNATAHARFVGEVTQAAGMEPGLVVSALAYQYAEHMLAERERRMNDGKEA